MIRFVKFIGYAWLAITTICLTGIASVIWLTNDWDTLIGAMTPEYLLITGAAFLPGLLVLFLENKEEQIEEQEAQDDERPRP